MRFKTITLLALSLSPLLAQRSIRLTQFVSGIDQPTSIVNSKDATNRLFITEQRGRIRVVQGGSLVATPFLDISSKVSCCNERGLLSVVFPPGYAAKKYFYVNYTNTAGNSVVARYNTTADPNIADPNSEIILFTVTQPFANHNGGNMVFGPDGYLYIGFGDGGSSGDPQGNGQNLNTLLGKLLRIDTESNPGSYIVPANNPFTQNPNARPEIWAYGLRNPWKFSFDRSTGDLYIGDVGQDTTEEVDFQPVGSAGGQNYGWSVTEGSKCYNATTCDTTGITFPVTEYSHSNGDCSVTGGFVYRGSAISSLQGTYLYADYCSGIIRGLKKNGSTWTSSDLLDTRYNITAFGEDEAGNVYVSDAKRGGIYIVSGPRN